MKRLVSLVVLLGAALVLHAEQKYATLNFLIVNANNGKPIRNASVVLHPVKKDGAQSSGGYQLKTDPDGKASFAGAPFGKLRVQVLVHGFQTYGEDFDINQETQDITVKLHRPKAQYSIYENKPADEKKPEEKPK
jgi:Carboxypeptidase regulatory-like domain